MGSKAGAGSAVPCPGQKLQGQSLDLSFSRVTSQRCSTKVQGKQEAEPPAWQQPLRAGWGQEQCQGESCEQLGAVGLLRAPWGFTWAPTSLCTLCSSAPHPPASPRASQGSSSACILPLPAAATLLLLEQCTNCTPTDPGQGVSSWKAFTPRQQLLVLGWSCRARCQDTAPALSCANRH